MFPCAFSFAGIEWIGDTPAAFGDGTALAQLRIEQREALLTLEPGQVAIVLGLENRQIGRQLSPAPRSMQCWTMINRTFYSSHVGLTATLGSG